MNPTKFIRPGFVDVSELLASDLSSMFASKSGEIAHALVTKGVNASSRIASPLFEKSGLEDKVQRSLMELTAQGASDAYDVSMISGNRGELKAAVSKMNESIRFYAEHYVDRILVPKLKSLTGKRLSKAQKESEIAKIIRNSDHYWKTVTNVFASRAQQLGATTAAVNGNLRKAMLVAVLDEVTTDFCRAIDGQIISTAKVKSDLETAILRPPSKVVKDSMWQTLAKMRNPTARKLVKAGLTYPPFHAGCRTTINYF